MNVSRVNMTSWRKRIASKLYTIAHGSLQLHSNAAILTASLIIHDRGGSVDYIMAQGTRAVMVQYKTWNRSAEC